MVQEYTHTDAFRGTPFREADFGGATFRDCDMSQVTITAAHQHRHPCATNRYENLVRADFSAHSLARLESARPGKPLARPQPA